MKTKTHVGLFKVSWGLAQQQENKLKDGPVSVLYRRESMEYKWWICNDDYVNYNVPFMTPDIEELKDDFNNIAIFIYML